MYKTIFLALVLHFITIVFVPIYGQSQSSVVKLEPSEVKAFNYSQEQIDFWLGAEDYISRELNAGVDFFSTAFYNEASPQQKEWLDSLDSGNSPYNTDHRSKYWGNNWLYATALINQRSDSLAYDFNLLTYWHSPKGSDGVGDKIKLVFEPAKNSNIKTVMIFPGNMRTPADWSQYGRPAVIKFRLNGKDIALLHLKNRMACQAFDIPAPTLDVKNKEINIEFEIQSTYPGSVHEGAAISEINFDGSNIL